MFVGDRQTVKTVSKTLGSYRVSSTSKPVLRSGPLRNVGLEERGWSTSSCLEAVRPLLCSKEMNPGLEPPVLPLW